jgi:hypothetical protein
VATAGRYLFFLTVLLAPCARLVCRNFVSTHSTTRARYFIVAMQRLGCPCRWSLLREQPDATCLPLPSPTNSVAPEPGCSSPPSQELATVAVLSQLNPLHTPLARLPKIYSDHILPSTPQSSVWSLSFGLCHQNFLHFSLLSHACHMSRPPYSP